MPTNVFAIQPNALIVLADRPSMAPAYDFTRLPYTDGQYDHQPDTRFVSASLASPPFDRPNHVLERGLHVHWLLPPLLRKSIALPALTRDFLPAVMPQASETERAEVWQTLLQFEELQQLREDTLVVRRYFPAWEAKLPALIKDLRGYPLLRSRLLGHGADGRTFPPVPNRWKVVRQVEGQTDAEWTIESDYIHPPEQPPAAGNQYTTYPWLSAYQDQTYPPFRYIGRRLEGGEATDQGHYLHEAPVAGPLTALGYGEPGFSSYYPNCRSVFGFHDADITEGGQLVTLSYHITGYYSHPHLDYGAMLAEYFASAAQHLMPEAEREWWVRQQWYERLGLNLANLPGTDTLCYNHLTFGWAALRGLDSISVTVANSSTEAIAARLSHEASNEKERTHLENLIESILMEDRLAGKAVDVGLKFLENRHEQEFQSGTGGYRWVFQPLSGADDDVEIDDEAFLLLASLNQKQKAYHALEAQLTSVQQQTFDDWHRYLYSLYPLEGTLDTFPNPDHIKAYMEREGLPKIQAMQAELGVLQIDLTKQGAVQGAAGSPESQAADLASLINQLQGLIPAGVMGLFRVPGTRYQLPKEPTVCLSGQPLLGWLHDQANPYHNLGFEVLEVAAQSLMAAPGALPEQLADPSQFAMQSEATGNWNPLFLDWQLGYRPLAGEKPGGSATRYDPDYILKHYSLEANRPNLSLRPEAGTLAEQTDTVFGRSILDPFPRQLVRSRLLDWCQQQLNISEAEPGDLTDPEVLLGLLKEDSPFGQEIELLLAAVQALDQEPMLTQALSGMNRILTGHLYRWQLPVFDPLGFAPYRAFAQNVREAVGKETLMAPLPWQDFHPIRAGEIEFRRFRLIDSFGQFRDLPIESVHGTSTMPVKDHTKVQLPARILQGTRLDFRWVQRTAPGLESQDDDATSPIAGWVLPEFLGRQLAIFDHNGVALGTLGQRGWTPAQFPAGPASVADITETSLRAFVLHLQQYFEEPGNLIRLLESLRIGAEHMEPETGQDDDFVSMIFGQPLALVHARLQLELQGLPLTNGNWDNAWRKIYDRGPVDSTHGFQEVHIPVRIGEHHQLNDGVMLWWEWQQEGDDYSLQGWHLPQDLEPEGRSQAPSPYIMTTTLAAPPKHLGMLINPLGRVHVTTGVLPVKSVDLPGVHYQEVLSQITGSLFAGPMITPAEAVEMPSPPGVHHRWQWIGSEQVEVPVRDPGPWRLPETVVIRDGWVKLAPRTDDDQNT